MSLSHLRPTLLLQKILSMRVSTVCHKLSFCILCSSSLPPRGATDTATQPPSTPGPSSLLFIDFCSDPWLLSVGTCIVSSPWIQRSPTFYPWWKEERSAETKKKALLVRSSMIESHWLHSASRIG